MIVWKSALQRDGLAKDFAILAVAPDLGRQRHQLFLRRAELENVGREGVFGAHRLARPVGLNGAIIDAARDTVIPSAGLAEMLLQEGQWLVAQIRAGLDPQPLHLCGGRGADAMKLLDRKTRDEVGAHLRCDDRLAIGLIEIARQFSQEFAIRNPGRRVEAGHFLDASAYFGRDLRKFPRMEDLVEAELAVPGSWSKP